MDITQTLPNRGDPQQSETAIERGICNCVGFRNATISKVIHKWEEYRSSSGHESGHDSDDMESFMPPESDTESDGAMSEGFCGDSESIVEKDEDNDEPEDVDYFDEVADLDEIGVYSDQDEGMDQEEV